MTHSTYICFFSPKDQDGYLSQWYKQPMEIGGQMFANCEQYMMYRKAMLFKDYDIAARILKESNPSIIKKLGRKVANFSADVWDAHKKQIVYEANVAKFADPVLKKRLLNTYPKILIEASPYDKIWGSGLNAFETISKYPYIPGQNLLGEALMKVREFYQKQQ